MDLSGYDINDIGILWLLSVYDINDNIGILRTYQDMTSMTLEFYGFVSI